MFFVLKFFLKENSDALGGSKMISTSSHKNWQLSNYNTYAISGNRGKDANYNGKSYPKLAPKLQFWKVWHSNIGIVSDEENNKFYIQEYYAQVLSKLDPEEVYRELDNSVLLCYEDNTEFCHRHIVAAWFEILLGVTVPEEKTVNFDIITVARPSFIKEYLDEVMRKNRNMRGFKSLRALYLFEKGEKLEAEADRLEQETGKSYDHYRQAAIFLRCNADEEEEKFNQKRLAMNVQNKR